MRLRWLIFGCLIFVFAAFPAYAQDRVGLDVLDQVNQARIAAGIPALILNDALTQAAQRQSNDMALTGRLLHAGSDGSEFWQRMQEAGYSLTGGAENILASANTDAASVFGQWNSSPPHQANMLNPAYFEIGIAYTKSSAGLFYFTMLLGSRENLTPQPVVSMTPSMVPTSVGILPVATATPPVIEPSITPLPALTSTPAPTTAAEIAASPSVGMVTNTPLPLSQPATPVSASYGEISQAVRDSLYYFGIALAPDVILAPTLTLAPVVAIPVATSVPPTSADLRLVYNSDSFALINVSGRKLDLKPLVFSSASGILEALRWQTQFLSEPLNAFTENDCLQVWSLEMQFGLDKPEGCAIRHSWIVVDHAGLFWKNTDNFTVTYAGETVATCATTATECSVSFAAVAYTPPPTRATPFMLTGVDIRLTISDLGVSLLNVSGRELDLSGLIFESSSGVFTAQTWNIPELTRSLLAFTPGDCLQVWALNTNYLNPPAECHIRHAWLSVGQQAQFWLNTDTFTVKQGEMPVATCTISAGTCDIDLPNQ